ncbi:Cdc6/Cdc18 family protein [Natrialba asiatica]|uniref:ORC1-type DNA replication protein n=1 Tax=Natrialba asiatica (strain ATCC 700177 / DSM 12278 / JCM 9576 / FERM P-10747 / NBRC 102637 / 172P1) TaxID=29540 RepID=M0AIV6_NATA1|nr:AAA family ATPase [Natrialba asiatica]ELY97338.1 cell division control protein 6 [Natrialba asiatica DSM 12278]
MAGDEANSENPYGTLDDNPYGTSVEIFADESVLKEDWQPEQLPEREPELEEIRNALAPATRGVNAHNLFLYGKTGQGKTVAIDHEIELLQEYADSSNELNLSVIKTSANNQTTSYQLCAHLIKEIRGGTKKPSGIDQQSMFDLLYQEISNLKDTVIIVIDEIDAIGSNDELLYELPRARKNGHIEDQWVSVIGISNNLQFRDNLSPKVKDSLYDSEIEFAPYNANQLTTILERRAERAFVDGVLDGEVIPLCSAFAAQDEGSARQAIRLLYKAGELALNHDDEGVLEQHVREARDILERKRIEEGMRSLTTQDQFALLSVVALEIDEETPARTRQVFQKYKSIVDRLNGNQLVERRVRDHLQSLGMQGFLLAETRNTGIQGGSHYRFELKTDLEATLDILGEDGRIDDVVEDLIDIATAKKLV